MKEPKAMLKNTLIMIFISFKHQIKICIITHILISLRFSFTILRKPKVGFNLNSKVSITLIYSVHLIKFKYLRHWKAQFSEFHECHLIPKSISKE